MAKRSILSHFPRHLTPRPVQRDTLLALEENWDKASVFVVNLPVASGKSAIAMTLINWQKHGKVITPTKLLVDQYQDEYPYLHVMRGKGEYYCESLQKRLSERTEKEGALCHTRLNCAGCEKYKKDLYQAQNSPFVLSNYFVYMAYGLTSSAETLIVDEAHNLISTLQEMHSKKIWRKDLNYPTDLKDREDIKEFFNNIPKDYYSNLFKRGNGKKKRGVSDPIEFRLYDKIKKFKEELNSERPKYMFELGTDKYRGEELECIKMLPLDIRSEPEILWSSTKKMVLLSATLSRKDIEQLGIADKKIQYIEADSPIRAELRPVILPAAARNMSLKTQRANLPALVEFIQRTADERPDVKGLIHATYGMAEMLRPYLKGDRFIWHTRLNKTEQYQAFRATEEPKILVASGMYEGIDLPYDAGRWQIITKVPWPYLGDAAIKYLCSLDNEWYAWEAIKDMLQACGRICRTPTDFGETFIFDNSFARLYNQNTDLFPGWFRNSIVEE